jgi:tRNA splicing endonuclease
VKRTDEELAPKDLIEHERISVNTKKKLIIAFVEENIVENADINDNNISITSDTNIIRYMNFEWLNI